MASARANNEREFLEWMVSLGARPDISIDMTLAEAGVDSLMLVEWAVAIEDSTGRVLGDALLENLYTLRDLEHYFNSLSNTEFGMDQ